MIFEDQIGIKLCVIGCVGALALIVTGVISEKDALLSIDLKTIFLFGGTLSLASALEATGAGELIADKVIGMLGDNPSPYILTFVIFQALLHHDKLYVKHSNDSTDGSDRSIHRTGHGCRSKCRTDGMCNRRILCICNTNRNAGQHHGSNGRRIYVQGLCESGIPMIVVATIVSMILLPIFYPFFP